MKKLLIPIILVLFTCCSTKYKAIVKQSIRQPHYAGDSCRLITDVNLYQKRFLKKQEFLSVVFRIEKNIPCENYFEIMKTQYEIAELKRIDVLVKVKTNK